MSPRSASAVGPDRMRPPQRSTPADEVDKLGRFDAEIHMRTSVSALAELMVRIHSPPPKSQRTFSPLQLNDPGRGAHRGIGPSGKARVWPISAMIGRSPGRHPRRGVLLLPQPRRRTPEAASGRLYRILRPRANGIRTLGPSRGRRGIGRLLCKPEKWGAADNRKASRLKQPIQPGGVFAQLHDDLLAGPETAHRPIALRSIPPTSGDATSANSGVGRAAPYRARLRRGRNHHPLAESPNAVGPPASLRSLSAATVQPVSPVGRLRNSATF
jgi:hypothetical protein